MSWQTLRTVEGEYVRVNMANVAFFAERRVYFCGGQVLELDPSLDVRVMESGRLQVMTWYSIRSEDMRREVLRRGLTPIGDRAWCTVDDRESLELTEELRS